MSSRRGSHSTQTPSTRATSLATPSRAASPPAPRRRRIWLPRSQAASLVLHLLLAGGLGSELEARALTRAQFAHVVSHSDLDPPAHALRIGLERQLPFSELDHDRGALELHRERQAVVSLRKPGIEEQDAVAD